MKKFWVKAGARLHLGQLDINGSLGRLYGGLGLAINEPGLEIVASKATGLNLICAKDEGTRVEKITWKYLKHYNLPGINLEILKTLPSHSGLGSGTQLALAIGFAITRVYGLESTIAELAVVTDREGSRSGIGVAAFEHGGFVVDGGRPVSPEDKACFLVPPVLSYMPFPEEWTIILAMPYLAEKIFGSKEEQAFGSLGPMEEHVSASICRLVLMKLLPSLKEKNLKGFGEAVMEIQKEVGDYFTPLQGGRYASPLGHQLEEFLLTQGAVGIGQSSWGPTIYGFVHQNEAEEILAKTRSFLKDQGLVWCAKGINQGASWGWKE